MGSENLRRVIRNNVKSLRRRLWHDQGGKCHYCGRLTVLPPSGDARSQMNWATLEHLVPLSQGGAVAGDNIVMACLECNWQANQQMQIESSAPDWAPAATEDRPLADALARAFGGAASGQDGAGG